MKSFLSLSSILTALALVPSSASAIGINFFRQEPASITHAPHRIHSIHARDISSYGNSTTYITPTSTEFETNFITLTIQNPTSTATPTSSPKELVTLVQTAVPSTVLSYDSDLSASVPVTVVQVTSIIPITLTEYSTVTTSAPAAVQLVTVPTESASAAIDSAVAGGATVNVNGVQIYDITRSITVTIPLSTAFPVSSDSTTTIFSTITSEEYQTIEVTDTISQTLLLLLPTPTILFPVFKLLFLLRLNM